MEWNQKEEKRAMNSVSNDGNHSATFFARKTKETRAVRMENQQSGKIVARLMISIALFFCQRKAEDDVLHSLSRKA